MRINVVHDSAKVTAGENNAKAMFYSWNKDVALACHVSLGNLNHVIFFFAVC